MNSIILTGNICNDLELKSTDSGKSVCSFNLAVKRPFAKDVTDFLTVVCWNKQAENVFKYCGKGTKIGISGTMTTRKWQDNEGNNRIAYEVVANEVEFLEKKADGQRNVTAKSAIESFQRAGDAIFENMSADTDGFVMVEEDDLPF